MNSLVGPSQSSFIEGRLILDSALIAGQLVMPANDRKFHLLFSRSTFTKPLTVSHGDSLVGFLPKSRLWIQSCIMTASSLILINGSPSSPFKHQRGLR